MALNRRSNQQSSAYRSLTIFFFTFLFNQIYILSKIIDVGQGDSILNLCTFSV